jgi:N-acetyl-anhydromuramyl-L-alanine amidase AmpD
MLDKLSKDEINELIAELKAFGYDVRENRKGVILEQEAEKLDMSRKKRNRKNTMPVDKERLLTAIRKKGIDVYKAGELCNKSRRYVRNFVDRGLIGENNIKDIETYLGISYSEYCPVDETENDKKINLSQLINIAKKENIEIEIWNNGNKIRVKPL